MQLDSQLCLIGKKKLPGRGITGFQVLYFCLLLLMLSELFYIFYFSYDFCDFLYELSFCDKLIICYSFQFLPQDSNKVMVSCADSQVRILDGLNVIGKYKSMFFCLTTSFIDIFFFIPQQIFTTVILLVPKSLLVINLNFISFYVLLLRFFVFLF